MNGIRQVAGAVFGVLALLGPAGLSAQVVERTDTPRAGELRLSFEPRIETWSQEFTPGGLRFLGAGLSGDTIGSRAIPSLTGLEQAVRTVTGFSGFVASLGSGTFSAYKERRVTPFAAELGITSRLSMAVYVPIVRVATRSALRLAQKTANLGANPLTTSGGTAQRYAAFFGQFNAVLAQLQDSVNAGHYGCPGSPSCTQAQADLARGTAVRDALQRTIYGSGSIQSPFVPLAGSVAGMKIDSSVAALQQQYTSLYHVAGFTDSLLLPTDTLNGSASFDAFIGTVVGDNDSLFGFGYNPLRTAWRYGLGPVALEAKYRIVQGSHYSAAVGLQARLPTATRDSTLEVMDTPVADLQSGLEGRVIQEWIIARRLWLNLAVRGGTELPGTRARRVAPFDELLVPFQATTLLDWRPGNYAAVDFAPLYRFAPQFAAGFTAAYWTKASDRYSYQTGQDSTRIASALGAPLPAGILDAGTAQEWLRVGLALTYSGPTLEGEFTVEQTVFGGSGLVPRAMVYQLRIRISRRLF